MTDFEERPELFQPEAGKDYSGRWGEELTCIKGGQAFSAELKNKNSGWVFTAHGIRRYRDGSIEWDYSTGGHFD